MSTQDPEYLVCYAMATNKKSFSVHFVSLCKSHDEAIAASRATSIKLINKVALMKIVKITSKYSIIKTMDQLAHDIENNSVEDKKPNLK